MKFKHLLLPILLALTVPSGLAQSRQCGSDTVRLSVKFPKGSAVIDSLFAGNSVSLFRLKELLADSNGDIASICIWGSTSPEGSKSYNRTLASRRAEALKARAVSYGAPAALIQFDENVTLWPDAVAADYPELRAAYIKTSIIRKSASSISSASELNTPNVTEETNINDEATSTIITTTTTTTDEIMLDATAESKSEISLYLRANLLRWATLTPDVGLELRFKQHYAVVVNGSWTTWSWNNKDRRYALREIAPELRYYIGTECRGYVGAMYKAGAFNYKLSEFGKQGNILGGGITGGYELPLNHCLNLDFSLGLGYLHTHYDRYNVIDGVRVRQGKGEKNWWGPISAGVTLTWKLF